MEKFINILLVEDDHLDAIDTRRTLDKMKISYRLHIARNGDEAVRFLEGNNTFVPDVALVDISMPKMNGFEFLSFIRSNDRWQHLKCFLITTSEEQADKEAAGKLGVCGYIVKPLKLHNSATPGAFNLMIDLMNLSASYPK
ncbi:MAG TPA: response regulator [Chitinophagaceae bacterium]